MFNYKDIDQSEDCILYIGHKTEEVSGLSSNTHAYVFEPLWVLTGSHTAQEQVELINLFTRYYSKVTEDPMVAYKKGRKVWSSNLSNIEETI